MATLRGAFAWPAALLLCAVACGGPASKSSDDGETMTTTPDDGDTETEGSSTDTEDPNAAWFQVGWGVDSFTPIESGAEFPIVWGSQGAAMFPMPIRGGNFVLPDDPRDYTDPRAPILDLELDIEGHNDGFGGHFKRIANYPLIFEILDDGTYEFLYLAIILPDDEVPEDLEGLPAHLHVQIRPYDSEPIERDLDLIVALEPLPE